jgi:hypothetical protein
VGRDVLDRLYHAAPSDRRRAAVELILLQHNSCTNFTLEWYDDAIRLTFNIYLPLSALLIVSLNE